MNFHEYKMKKRAIFAPFMVFAQFIFTEVSCHFHKDSRYFSLEKFLERNSHESFILFHEVFMDIFTNIMEVHDFSPEKECEIKINLELSLFFIMIS